jgi:hypothetical protein
MTKPNDEMVRNILMAIVVALISGFGFLLTDKASQFQKNFDRMANSLDNLEKGFAKVNNTLVKQDFRLNWIEKKLQEHEKRMQK